jgi:hypothetical protein
MERSNKKPISCDYCKRSGHFWRVCKIEKKLAVVLKQKMGSFFEGFIQKNIYCPCCGDGQLILVGGNKPSFDGECDNCKTKFEFKSHCLSVHHLPKDIYILHGLFNQYMKKITKEGLNLITIIYGVNRSTFEIEIREILHATNEQLQDESLIINEMREDEKNTLITITDRTKLNKLDIDNTVRKFSFANTVQKLYYDMKEEEHRERVRKNFNLPADYKF